MKCRLGAHLIRRKRANDMVRTLAALNRGADAIENMVEANFKGMEIAAVMLNIEKQKTMVSLF